MKNVFLNNRGFTLVEIVIAITIIAILSTFGIFNYGAEVARSKANTDLYNARQIAAAINRAYIDGQLKDGSGYIDSSLFSDTAKLPLNETTGIGKKIFDLNYIPEPGTFKIKGRERDAWKFGYTLTLRGVLKVYVCENSWAGANGSFSGTQSVMVYPTVDTATTIHPYDAIKSK